MQNLIVHGSLESIMDSRRNLYVDKGDSSMLCRKRIKCHMNLSFLLIWEQDECGSSDPIGIGALDVKLSYLE